MCLIDCDLQTLNRDRIFCTNINIALRCADCVTGNRHCFQHHMRVAFQHGTIHECTRIAFVGVAANIFLISLISRGKCPLAAGGEACATASAQTGSRHLIDNLFRGHFRQCLAKSGITVHGDVLINIFGINHTAVAQCSTALLCIEIGFVEGLDAVLHNGLLIKQTLDNATLKQMLFHDLRNILHRDAAIKAAFRVNDHNRTEGAKTKAAGAHNVNFFFQSAFCNFFLQGFNDFFAVRGGTTRTAAYKHIGTIHSVSSLL